MNYLFDPENRFWSFMNKIMDVFFIGILWFVFSLPVVTAGAALTALYQFTLKQADDEEGYVWRSFRRAFVKNFPPVHGFVADSFGGVGLPCGGHLRLSSYGIARDVADALFSESWSVWARFSAHISLHISAGIPL